ncbi:MAG: hypothetical protein IKS45_06375, partial [Thermoguttaceae bacterium]|nr:hypothetical protein [Thermoguttaceae bacterium]
GQGVSSVRSDVQIEESLPFAAHGSGAEGLEGPPFPETVPQDAVRLRVGEHEFTSALTPTKFRAALGK